MTQNPAQQSRSTDISYNVERPPKPRRTYALPVDEPADRIREIVRADVEYRLMDLCSNWSTGEFDRVVADVTDTTLKFHGVE